VDDVSVASGLSLHVSPNDRRQQHRKSVCFPMLDVCCLLVLVQCAPAGSTAALVSFRRRVAVALASCCRHQACH
jgi:hypothetical protein